MKLKDQRQQKRTRATARRVAGKVGHGRDDDGADSAFELGDRVTVQPHVAASRGIPVDGRMVVGTVVAQNTETGHWQRQGMVHVRLDRPSSGGGRSGLEAANHFVRVQLFHQNELLKYGDHASLRVASERERLAARAAAREQREIERQDREADRALVTILLHKRALLAGGDVEAATSPQGTSPLDVPTEQERAVLVRALYHPEELTSDDDPAMPLDLRAVQRVGVDWPVAEDRALLVLANEKLEQRDPCAARLLARW